MQTNLAPEFKGTPDGDEAEAILRKCVHCGFCTATCPTYQLLGDELDGPRGRIYLMKQVLEGAAADAQDAAAPGPLPDLPQLRDAPARAACSTATWSTSAARSSTSKVARPAGGAALRWLLKEGLTSPLFAPGDEARPGGARRCCRRRCKNKVPARSRRARSQWPTREHARKVLMLLGCVQPAMMPNINSATARVLDAAGIQTLVADEAGCCGAIRIHLNDHDGGLADMRAQHRRLVAAGRGLTSSAGRGDRHERLGLRRHRQGVRPRAGARPGLCRQGAAHQRADARPERAAARPGRRALQAAAAGAPTAPAQLAFHPPCTLQHGQQLRGGVETHLARAGLRRAASPPSESHLCCGSAGTYSVLQPELAYAAARPQARPPRSRCSRRPSSRPTSAASSTCRAAPPRRCGTGSKCSTTRWR